MALQAPRYLAPFHPKHIPHFFTDVLIIGGGLAGLRAANAVDSKLSALVVTKDELKQSNSNFAQGGIAGVLGPDDRFEDHVADTMTAGGDLCDQQVVEMVVREAPDHINELIRWGTEFDRDSGKLTLGREGGHGHNRIVHALGDATGKEVMRAVIEWTRRLRNVEILERTFTLDLLTHEGVCRGALVADEKGAKTLVWAKQTILCTGGVGQVYRESTNPPVATGDGHAIAFRAGAELRDMEFVQFHPTVLYIAGSSRSLITEAIRGEGGRLVDRQGHRFMLDYDERAELAPRDVVSQAIASQMAKTRHPCVYLDLSHLDPDFVLKRFPGIAAILRHRIAHELYRLGAVITARVMAEYSHERTAIDIHPGARIGPSFFIDHGTGVVIGETAVIGRNVRLYQQVLLGAKRFEADESGALVKGQPRHPVVEDDVVIYAGAAILGRITIGRGSVIGGGVWLTEGTAPGTIVTQAKPHLSVVAPTRA